MRFSRIIQSSSVQFLRASIFSGVLFIAAAARSQNDAATHPAPEWGKLFQRTNGWIGADGNYSVPLSEGKILWLFSDTWIGEVKDGKRVNPRMINNSIGIQSGTDPATATVEFVYGRDKDGKADAFIKPKHGRGYFWLFGGARTGEGVFLFLQNVETYKTGTPFGFRTFDTVLGHITNPEDEPARWKIQQKPIPFAKFAPDEKLMLGGAVLQEKPFIYIFGTHTQTNRNRHSALVVARVRENRLANFGDWEFFAADGWSKSLREMQSLLPKTASEFSVSWLPNLKKYVLVQSDGIFGRIKTSFAEKPEGPWSEPKIIYQKPESKWKGVFCYAAKAHPELDAAGNDLMITYAANTWNVQQVIDDARLYWPRFVRVPIAALEQ